MIHSQNPTPRIALDVDPAEGTPAEGGPSIAFSHHTLLLEALKAESLSSISLALDRLHAWIDIPACRYPISIMYQKYTICRYRDRMAVYLGALLEPSLSPVSRTIIYS